MASSDRRRSSASQSGPTPVSSDSRVRSSRRQNSSSTRLLSEPTPPSFTVQDIGGSLLPQVLSSMLSSNLFTPDSNGKRLLSSPLLSDTKGLKKWSKITHLPDYYQTRDEIELLTRCGAEIVHSLKFDYRAGRSLTVVDLGAGDIRKVLPLLQHLSAASIPTTYYALDLSHTILLSAMKTLQSLNLPHITCHGLWGTFDSALSFVQTLPPATPRLFLSLGSSFGNDFYESAVERLRAWRNEMRESDRMLLGMDGTTNLSDIWESYHPQNSNLFEKFMRNGLAASNKVLGIPWYKDSDWSVEGVLTQEPYIMHRFVFTAKKEVRCEKLGLIIAKGEMIDCYEAFKYGREEMREQFRESGLREENVWGSESGRINQYLLSRDNGLEAVQFDSQEFW